MTSEDQIRETAQRLRTAIERAREAEAPIPWLGRFPVNCCNFAANLLLLDLSDAGVTGLRRMLGTVCDARGDDVASHVWVTTGDVVVDITADHFDQPAVIVERGSEWHESLTDVKPFIARQDVPEGIRAADLDRLKQLYADVIEQLAAYR